MLIQKYPTFTVLEDTLNEDLEKLQYFSANGVFNRVY